MTETIFISAIIACAISSYWAGLRQGRKEGSEATIVVLEGMGLIKVDKDGEIEKVADEPKENNK